MARAEEVITVVSGLPRSGTSMMMRILVTGGLPPLIDQVRRADVDNPQGYYEFERVKQIEKDTAWLPEARGKVFKLVSMLLFHLPAAYEYRIVFMRRPMAEILASQAKMLARLGKPPGPPDDRMAAWFERHLGEVMAWLARQPNLRVQEVAYGDVLASPRATAERLQAFLERPLDVAAMAAVVDPALYRNRT